VKREHVDEYHTGYESSTPKLYYKQWAKAAANYLNYHGERHASSDVKGRWVVVPVTLPKSNPNSYPMRTSPLTGSSNAFPSFETQLLMESAR